MPKNSARIVPPLRKVVGDPRLAASIHLECGHLVDARPGFKQPKRMRCITCLPLDQRRKYIEQELARRIVPA